MKCCDFLTWGHCRRSEEYQWKWSLVHKWWSTLRASEVTSEGGCERKWLRWGGVGESGVITAMSAKSWHCLVGKRRRRPSKRQGEREERLSGLLRGGDERVNGEEELFDLRDYDVLIILPHHALMLNVQSFCPVSLQTQEGSKSRDVAKEENDLVVMQKSSNLSTLCADVKHCY